MLVVMHSRDVHHWNILVSHFPSEWLDTSIESIKIQASIDDIKNHNFVMRIYRDVVQWNPRVASSPSTNEGVLPLHLLLMFGYVQDNYNIHDLVKVSRKSLTARDPVYKLYSFLLAACNPCKLKLNNLIDFSFGFANAK